MSASAKEYMNSHYKTMKREDVIKLFNISKIKFGNIYGHLYDENEEIKKFIDDKIFKLKSEGMSHIDISYAINFSCKRVCDICKIKKETNATNIKKEKYWNFIKNKFDTYKQKIIDLKCETGEDYEILNELCLENKIDILPPTEKDCCVRVKLGGTN